MPQKIGCHYQAAQSPHGKTVRAFFYPAEEHGNRTQPFLIKAGNNGFEVQNSDN